MSSISSARSESSALDSLYLDTTPTVFESTTPDASFCGNNEIDSDLESSNSSSETSESGRLSDDNAHEILLNLRKKCE